ncbi:hypothetical protein [Rhizobium sp. 18055]|uniref:hypothetical protein n=1 Tax=Rhizobium sp. 18055 TaxID=2681403 RepID=UPI00135B19ED|nr:hypothetical protein [Rhizobium sp. 18055]
MSEKCTFSTYRYACGKPVEHGRYLCEEHVKVTCASCGNAATHGCDYCGQFVCGTPLCDECTYSTDKTKAAGNWGFMNHVHVSKPEFADKHRVVKLEAALAAKDAEIERLREALSACADHIDNYYFEGDKEYQVVIVARAALKGDAA